MSSGLKLALLLTATAGLCAEAGGEIKQVRSYPIDGAPGSYVQAALAIAPDQDVLLLIPKKSGIWQFRRVRNWREASPVEQTIDVPGIALPEKSEGSSRYVLSVGAELFVIPNSDLVVGSATAEFEGRGTGAVSEDSIELVVDLRTFEVVNTVHHGDGAPFQISRWQRYMDHLGRLVEVRETAASDDFAHGSSSHESELNFLMVPGLAPYGNCTFSDDSIGKRVILHNGLCGPSLPALLDGLVDSRGLPYYRIDPSSPWCEVTGVSRGQRFRAEDCRGKPETAIYAGAKSKIGSINEDTRNSSKARFAEHNGHDYFLVLEGGTQLKVYEITKPLR